MKVNNRVKSFIKNPKKALFKLAVPMVIAMLVQVLYSVVDTAFVGRLGVDALAALTFSWPIFFILFAITGGLSAGMGSRIAQALGSGNKGKAENIALHGLLLSFIVAVLFFIIGIFYLNPLLFLLGASGLSLFYAEQYLSILLIGIFFMYISFTLSTIFSSQGDAKTPMIVQTSSLVLNIILDPIFIFWLGLGVPGAAIATVLSFLFSIVLNISFIKKRSYLNIHINYFKYSYKIVKDIFVIGAPTIVAMLLMSFSFIILNKFMAFFSIEHVAMLGMVARLESTIMMPINALAMATMTLAGMFYGAKRYDLLKEVSFYSIKIAVVFTVVSGLILFTFPRIFLRIFTDDIFLINLAVPYLRYDVFDFWMISVGIIASRVLRGMGHGLPGLFMVLLRVIFVMIPLAYLFVFVFRFNYISLAIAVVLSGAIYAFIGILWLKKYFNSLQIN
jgi:putative MATE family efflux protein